MSDTGAQAEGKAACAHCGTIFLCAMQTALERSIPCWCANLPPLRPVAGRGCLCRDCLERQLKEQA